MRIKDDGEGILKEAGRVARSLDDLEHSLVAGDHTLRKSQRGKCHSEGDPLFRAGVGFAIARESADISGGQKLMIYIRNRAAAVKVMADFYINVAIAARSETRIASLLSELDPMSSPRTNPAAVDAVIA